MGAQAIDYYEFLQISPHADADTIRRVYRFLAARLHPDNHATGHVDNFRLLKAAYDVLSDPRRRAEYDATRIDSSSQPLSTTIDFMDSLEGELNRRMAVLAVLYSRRRTSPNFPEVALGEIEERMGFPRDYLDFTLWYLQKKGYISKADNAQYTLTVDGVDFVERERSRLPTLHKLLTSGSGSSVGDQERSQRNGATAFSPNRWEHGVEQTIPASKPSEHSSTVELAEDRRAGRPDRRVGAPDLRAKKVERRFNARDRRSTAASRREP